MEKWGALVECSQSIVCWDIIGTSEGKTSQLVSPVQAPGKIGWSIDATA